MSTLKAINLVHPTSATNNIVLDSSGNMTAGGTLAMSSSFMRNRIINGAMVVDQRNAGASSTVTTSSYVSCDRWQTWASATSKYSIEQTISGTSAPAGFTDYLGATSLSAYSVSASDNFSIYQAVEGFNVADFDWGTASAKSVTLSFWVRSSLTGTFGGAFSNSAVNMSYPFTYTISAANTWEYKTITVAGDTTGTWVTNNGIGLRLWFSLGAGSTYLGTAGAWAAADYRGATGQTNLVGTNGATFYITGVQLEVGTVATPFEREIYSETLAKCQRYYQITSAGYNTGAPIGTVGMYAATTSYCCGTMRFAVLMRAAPTVSIWVNGVQNRARNALNGSTVTITTLNLPALSTLGLSIVQDTGGAPFSAGTPYDFDLQLSSEL